MKVKQCLVEDKRHIRFNDWTGHDVSAIKNISRK